MNICKCGCKEVIKEQFHHKYYGIPKYISGHNTRGKTNTKISQIMKLQYRLGIRKIPTGRKKEGVDMECLECNKSFYVPQCRKDIAGFCSHKCYSLNKIGTNIGPEHPNWNGGSSSEEYPLEFNRIRDRKIIQIRDEFTCQLCGDIILKSKREDKIKLALHHIDYNKHNNSEDNLIALCTFCNNSVNKNREDWTEFFQEKITNEIKVWEVQ